MEHARQFYIGGKWVAPLTSETMDVINPATEEVITSIALGGEQDVDTAVAAARAAFETFSVTTKDERLALLDSIIAVYSRRLEELADVISQEMGAPLSLARAAQAVAGLAHIGTARAVLADFEFERPMGRTLLVREPVGVCGMITPWNWPLNQIACKVAPALATGCTMVLKPSEVAPLNAILFAEILDEAGVPAGCSTWLTAMASPSAHCLSSHPDIDMLSFTGSTRAGVEVARAAADRQARRPGTRRQVRQHHPGRCRPRSRRRARHGRYVHELGPVLQRSHPDARPGRSHGRSRRHRGGSGQRDRGR